MTEALSPYDALLAACLEILPDMPTGLEPAGQSMDTTMRQHRIKEWRKAVLRAARDRGLRPSDRRCDQCGGVDDVRFIPDPECGGVHAWHACVACRTVGGSDENGAENDG